MNKFLWEYPNLEVFFYYNGFMISHPESRWSIAEEVLPLNRFCFEDKFKIADD